MLAALRKDENLLYIENGNLKKGNIFSKKKRVLIFLKVYLVHIIKFMMMKWKKLMFQRFKKKR